jgi:hypothetical protein
MWVPSTEPKPDGGPFTAEKVPCRTLRSISNQGVTRTESWFWVRVSPEVFARVVQKFLSALKPYLQSQVQFPGPDFLSRESGHLGGAPRLMHRSSN